MNKYETVLIIKNDISEKDIKNTISKIENYLKKEGTIIKCEDLGPKKLAYEIRKHTTGYYYIITFKANSEKISELERICRITDEILKFITIKIKNYERDEENE